MHSVWCVIRLQPAMAFRGCTAACPFLYVLRGYRAKLYKSEFRLPFLSLRFFFEKYQINILFHHHCFMETNGYTRQS